MFHAVVFLAGPLSKRVFCVQRSDETDLAVIRHIGATFDRTNVRTKWLFYCFWYHQSVVVIADGYGVQLAKLEQFAEGVYSLRGGRCKSV